MSTEDENTNNATDDNSSEEINFLAMSDEQIADMVAPTEEVENTDTSGTETTDEASKDDTGSDDSEGNDDSESTTQDTDDEGAADSDSATSDESDDEDSGDQSTETGDGDSDTSESSEESDNTDSDEDNTELSQAEKDMKTLLSPFKANGKQMQIDNVDEARKLMSMGANYAKKMASIKPNLKIVKMLENADLLDEGKLNNLIDLSQKNPAAIKQLIKDSGIDPLGIDVKEDASYTPGDYSVSESSVDLDLVLSDLKDTPKFRETMDIVGNKLDEASRKVLVGSPAIIRVISEHVELGIYDKIDSVVQKERMLGRLTGLNDLEAYKQVSDAINANGGFGPANSKSAQEKTDTTTNSTATKKDDKKTKQRKKSAASTNSVSSNKGKKDFDILSMSDEDIAKLDISKYG